MASIWVDVPPKKWVKECLLGKEHASSGGSKYKDLIQWVELYQALTKDNPQLFVTRVARLRGIQDAAVKAMAEARSAGHVKYCKLLAERAAGKAMYLEEISRYLQQNPDQVSDVHGFLEQMSLKRMPTVPQPPPTQQGWQKGKVGGGGFAMVGSVAFEQMDPYHREFEVHLASGSNPWRGAHGGGMGMYMVEWANKVLNEGYDKPFLAFLEVSDVCHFSVTNGFTSVKYARNGELLAETSLVTLVSGGGRLHETKASGVITMFDTQDAQGGKAGKYHAKAFVWTLQGDLVVGMHETGKIHHSSLVGGGVVKCAGMIAAQAGRVTYVDSNSGHYRPDAAHVHAFIKYLDGQHLFTPEAVTMVQGNEVSITDYLANPARSFFGPGMKLGTHRGT